MSRVDLGFLEKPDKPWLINSNYFPSKVGGKPAWLELKHLPSTEELLCKKCNQTMIFLCQIYAPVEDKDSCFHRTIFIFICRKESCCLRNDNSNLIILRCQLPHKNDFYPEEPPDDNIDKKFKIEHFMKICFVCGISASKHCSKCKNTSYCTREHQLIDWKSGHKNTCGIFEDKNENHSKLLFEEWELVMGHDEDTSSSDQENDEEAEERRMEEYNRLVVEGKTGTMTDVSETDLESHASVDQDKTFSRFRKRIAADPDQILRYNRGGQPLWVASDPKPSEIPNCEYCNSPRQFEFQILPQLLYSLHENIIDWGILTIYTCKESCDLGPVYKKEYIFKQDVSENNK